MEKERLLELKKEAIALTSNIIFAINNAADNNSHRPSDEVNTIVYAALTIAVAKCIHTTCYDKESMEDVLNQMNLQLRRNLKLDPKDGEV